MEPFKCPGCGKTRTIPGICPFCAFPLNQKPVQTKTEDKVQPDITPAKEIPLPEKKKNRNNGPVYAICATVVIVTLIVVLGGKGNSLKSSATPSSNSYVPATSEAFHTASPRAVSATASPTPRKTTSTYSSWKKSDYTDDEYEYVLYTMAKDTIKSYLKAPSTASFCKQSECKFVHAEEDTFMMTGWVESQNSYGAMLRKTWGVMAGYNEGHMIIVMVTIGDNTYFP